MNTKITVSKEGLINEIALANNYRWETKELMSRLFDNMESLNHSLTSNPEIDVYYPEYLDSFIEITDLSSSLETNQLLKKDEVSDFWACHDLDGFDRDKFDVFINDHNQAREDLENHFNVIDITLIDDFDCAEWLWEHKQLKEDYLSFASTDFPQLDQNELLKHELVNYYLRKYDLGYDFATNHIFSVLDEEVEHEVSAPLTKAVLGHELFKMYDSFDVDDYANQICEWGKDHGYEMSEMINMGKEIKNSLTESSFNFNKKFDLIAYEYKKTHSKKNNEREAYNPGKNAQAVSQSQGVRSASGREER